VDAVHNKRNFSSNRHRVDDLYEQRHAKQSSNSRIPTATPAQFAVALPKNCQRAPSHLLYGIHPGVRSFSHHHILQ